MDPITEYFLTVAGMGDIKPEEVRTVTITVKGGGLSASAELSYPAGIPTA